MDGHVLLLSGAVVFVCWLMMLHKIQCGGLISIVLIIVSIRAMNGFPNIYEIMSKYR
jgi:hypothetical protein